jgi:ATP-dependent helicase/nuclease subunit A
MTIHQSKGLEFPVVFLYKSGEAGLSNTIKSKEVSVNKHFGLLTKVPINQDYLEEYSAAPVIAVYNFIEEKKNLAELKRLLYVAVTRAKDELYITSTIEKDKALKKDSFIKLLSEGLNNDFTGDKIIINEELEYLVKINDNYENKKENIITEILITSEIELIANEEIKIEQTQKELEIKTELLKSDEKGEIVSASKVSIYSQCPLKYFLTYEYGFGKLNSDYLNHKSQSKKNILQENSEETDNDLELRFETYDERKTDFNSALYGKLFHGFMEQHDKPEQFDEYLNEYKSSGIISDEQSKMYLTKLKDDANRFFRSETGKIISAFPDYKNEFEIYVKKSDFYLYGIIDKIIFEKDKLIIVDFKTDEIEENEIKKHTEYYLMQLKFYIYIASRLFADYEIFEGNLLFIKHPDIVVRIVCDKNQINDLEKEITSIINSIESKIVFKNFNHCAVCSYSGFTKKCIVK